MHQRNPWRRWITTAVAGSALLISGVVAAPAVSAVPSRDINQVRTQVRDLQARAEAATERYNKARSDLAAVQDTLDGLHQRISRERAQLQEILSTVDDLARSTYTSGGMDSSLQVLLADNPSEFLAQAAALDQVAQSQTSALRRTQTARLRLAQSEAEVKDKEAIAQKYRDDMASSKEEADQRLNEAEGVLAGLEAAERARLAAIDEAERQAGIAAGNTASANLSFNGPSSAGGGYAGGGRASAAVSYALSQVGKPYSFSASPPYSWDCSKLTSAAWAQAGVGITPLSYTQFSQVRRISDSELQPGDLVFYFGGGAHHVAMYIGGGKMVSASNPSDGVEVTDYKGPWYGERYSGAGRVVG